ncbi:MAG: hypothetical protein JWP74_758 [Marmoricola sp.]|nr:hypothetical protein [Marmoricola sp.]
MGLLLVFLPADFRIAGHVYDALPDPVGWLLVLSGLKSLRGHLDVDIALWFGWVALAVSVPLWFPQLVEHLPTVSTTHASALLPSAAKHGRVTDPSLLWALSLPQAAFSLLLVKSIGDAGALRLPRDVFVAGRFGLLQWAFGATILLPPIAFGADRVGLVNSTLLGIGLINLAFIYYLFRVHRRTWLGGPGPLLIHPRNRDGTKRVENDEGRPPV